MDLSLISKAEEYINFDPNLETTTYITNLLKDAIDSNDNNHTSVKELKKLLLTRMSFGTAGLRGPMGAGYCRMNDIVIMQTMQGLVRYLDNQFGEEAKSMGVIIGYDHRRLNSLSSVGFSRMCAAVLNSQGYKAYCLEGFVPTPFVAFGVTHLKCAAGIMITASHNPKADNGFKVYWANGSQIIQPHDAGIATAISNNLEPWHRYDIEGVINNQLYFDVTTKIADAYYESIATLSNNQSNNTANPVKIVYTAMHGVGYQWVRRAFDVFNHPTLVPVPCQQEADPEFSTVLFPNPEEKGALDKSMKYADEINATVIIANDPDADRLAVAEKNDGVWSLFTGNEIGVLLGYWQIRGYKENKANSDKKPALLASVVSSRMLKKVALTENCDYFDTLTGFKWLGNKAIDLQAKGVQVLLAYEEALGFCIGNVVNDKDGVSAAAVFTEMVGILNKEGRTVKDQLNYLYLTYGEFISYNSYLISHDNAITDAIFHRLRNGKHNDGNYWSECAGSKIVVIKDITKGYDSSSSDLTSDLPATPESHMIMFEFDNGCTVTLRTSGTEPKIKYYTEIAGNPGEKREDVVDKLHSFVNELIMDMLQPDVHGLGRP